MALSENLMQLVFYVPEDAAEKVKAAVFSAGAGRVGNYAECCWQTVGRGQFRPLAQSTPSIGETGKLEHVREIRVETVVPVGRLQAVVDALLAAHPYETPAYSYWPVNDALPGTRHKNV